jgi:endonuclease/exonuclease/phosphatase family metal-dependent hydrolase
MTTLSMPTTRRRLVTLVAGTVLSLGGVVATGQTAQAASAPGDLRAVDVATKGVALTWDKSGEDAYRVRISTSSSMSTAVDAWDVLGNYYEWTRTNASPSARAPRLTPGKTYYFQVKSITRADDSGDRDDLSSYSKAYKVTLPKTGPSELKPSDVKLTQGGSDTMYVSWRSRGPGVRYVLRYTSTPSVAVTKWKSVKLDTSGGIVKNLDPGKKYYFRSRVIDTSGTGISSYSDSGPNATMGTSKSPGIAVATYNVRKMYSEADWTGRRKAVAANIKSAAPDVIGLQEAIPKTYKPSGKKQWDDLITLMGSPYKLVTSGSGSSGTQMAYNTSRLTMVKSGLSVLAKLGEERRYAVWATFKDKVSGKSFFAVSTHLEPGTTTPELNDIRKKQAGEIVKIVADNAGGLPSVIVGDMNTTRTAEPNNGQYGVFTGAGYVDPIDNAEANWASGANATAEHIWESRYFSANKLTKKAPLSSYPNGSHIDYTYTSRDIRVATWRMYLNLNTAGEFVGTIPSDHNLIEMTIHLP